jgi:bifunctional UDP-N-acetylglucosamine pyrophosphorylase/glucosamine-1-phosphate N-acetyltransferase
MLPAFFVLAMAPSRDTHWSIPPALLPLAGRPVIQHVLDAAGRLGTLKPVVFLPPDEEAVARAIADQARAIVYQAPADISAVIHHVASELPEQVEQVLVTSAHMPLLTSAALETLLKCQHQNPGPFSVLTFDPGTVPARQPGPAQVKEQNTGIYCFDAQWLWSNLDAVPLILPHHGVPSSDLIEQTIADGLQVATVATGHAEESLAVDTPLNLPAAEHALRRRTNTQLLTSGVILIDPATTYVEPDVEVGAGTTIWPNTHLRGSTTVGENATIGPNSVVVDSLIGHRCKVTASIVEHAVMEDDSDVGPFGHLRKGAHLCKAAHMGNFGELKNATLGENAKMGHFSYVGDATVGPGANIGAGTITCNFDGVHKHRTEIGAGAFIGSDTLLVAPVHVGERAKTGAGSVVTHDVPDGALAYGVPARLKGERTDEGTNN